MNRVVVLAAIAAVALLCLAAYRAYRHRATAIPDRLGIDELGLELMSGCCAFVVFTSPSCRPCKAALAVVGGAAAGAAGPTEVREIDATRHPDLAVRYGVRTIPTVFLITASGHVVRRWLDVPDPADARSALATM